MLTFDKLSESQQSLAVERCLTDLLEDICSGAIRFDDGQNGDDLQTRIDKAGEKAEAMQTPWFWHEYIMDTCRDDLEGMARRQAEDALYPEAGEFCITGIAA